MPQKKRSGLLPMLFGAVVGAAAVIFSKKENRDKAKKATDKAVSDVKKFKTEYDQDKDKAMKKVQKKAENMLDGAVDKAKEIAQGASKCCKSKKKDA